MKKNRYFKGLYKIWNVRQVIKNEKCETSHEKNGKKYEFRSLEVISYVSNGVSQSCLNLK
jgi:hypothetical protein